MKQITSSFLFLSFFITLTFSLFNNNLCPISNLRNYINDNTLPYPDLYFSNYNFNNNKNDNKNDYNRFDYNDEYYYIKNYNISNNNNNYYKYKNIKEYYNCTSIRMEDEEEIEYKNYNNLIMPLIHKCIPNLCPVNKNYIERSESVIKWKPRVDGLCNLKYLNYNCNKKNLNYKKENCQTVNIIVFGGSMTYGGITNGVCCQNPLNNSSPCYYDLEFDIKLKPERHYCSWFGHLSWWLAHEYPYIEFSFYNLALSGTTSSAMASEVYTLFQNSNISLTSRDIILLDHSCNDEFTERGLDIESLVREIYHYAHDLHHKLIDSKHQLSLPLHNEKGNYPTIIIIEQYMRGPTGSTEKPFDPNDPDDYRTGYREVSEAYKLLYFSFSEVTWSRFKSETQTEPIHDDPSLKFLRFYELHSPWHVHLFISDILAGFMLSIQSKYCESNLDLLTLHNTHPSIPISPLSQFSKRFEEYTCDANKIPLINSRPHSTFHPKNLTDYESKLINGWEDFIDMHQQSAWIITENSNPNNRTMKFPFDLQRVLNSNYDETIVIRVQYMRTYNNAGWFEIKLCSKVIAQLDTLFGHHKTIHISVPHWFTISRSITDLKAWCKKDNSFLEIKYEASANKSNNNIRGTRKVKIYSLEMCFHDNNQTSTFLSDEDELLINKTSHKVNNNNDNKYKYMYKRKRLR